ncbi:MAG: triacylglycerol lipase [Solirubrobacteraceae bacterium]|jgi:pimeloyl-ACP methyl ester carboxylesterase|nr:triacylglycerol lipase [Solirubrobacteraceae bacterium]
MATTPPIWREGRAAGELAALLRSPIWRSPPASPVPGQPVLLVPGLLASDSTLTLMARWLKRAGYAPRRAGIAVNVDCSEAEMGRLVDRLERATSVAGRRAVVVGHSRGGVFARALAVRRPDLVAGIVTMGSPLVDPLRNVHPFLHLQLEVLSSLGDLGLGRVLRHTCADARLFDEFPEHALSRVLLRRARRRMDEAEASGDGCCTQFWEDFRAEFPSEAVRFVSLFSRSDGIVHYEACLDPAAEQVEVPGTHCGMAASAPVYREVSAALRELAGPGEERLAA